MRNILWVSLVVGGVLGATLPAVGQTPVGGGVPDAGSEPAGGVAGADGGCRGPRAARRRAAGLRRDGRVRRDLPVAPAAGTGAGGDAWTPGDVFRDCDDCPEMVVVPAGTFRMGCVSGQDSFAANAWGPYDVHGNVWEWVQDCWHGELCAGAAGRLGLDAGRRLQSPGTSWRLLVEQTAGTPFGQSNEARSGRPNYATVGFRVARTLPSLDPLAILRSPSLAFAVTECACAACSGGESCAPGIAQAR